MFDQRKADKIDNALDTIGDELLAMGVSKPTLRKLIDFHHALIQDFERLANNRNPFED